MRLHVVIGALAALAWSSALATAPWRHEVDPRIERGERTRDLRLRFEVRNTDARVVSGATLEALIPAAATPTQRLLRVEASHDATLRRGRDGHRVLAVALPTLPPHGVALVTVTARVAVREEPERAPAPGGWATQAEPLIEVDAAAIQQTARGLAKADPRASAESVFRWVTARITAGAFTARDRGALEALTSGQGDCSEMAYLFVALARAAGVPARYMGGYVVASSALLEPRDYHNWAEWYDGRTWRVADPHGGVFDDAQGTYIATNVGGTPDARPLDGTHRYRVDARGLRARLVGGR